MATFEIKGPDGATYEIDGADEQGALAALKKHLGQSSSTGTGFANRAAGMSHQQMVDTYRSLPQSDPFVGYLAGEIAKPQHGETPEQASVRAGGNGSTAASGLGAMGNRAATFLQGVPFLGEYTDEALGSIAPYVGPNSAETATQAIRDGRANYEAENPKSAMGLKIAGGITGSIPMLAAAPFSAGGMGASLPLRMASGGAVAGVVGGTEGAVSGYGEGTDPESRKAHAKKRALIGALLGIGVGTAAPAVMAGGKKVANEVLDWWNMGKDVQATNLSEPAYQILSRAMSADDSLGGSGMQRILAGGRDAMPVDAGPTARSLLDTAIQRSGPAGVQAGRAIEERAANANSLLGNAMDATLGLPQGVRETAKGIAQSTAPARQAAYDTAYSNPIDYAASEGRAIEDVLARIPARVKMAAVTKANEAMQAAGIRNQQIMATIGKDGSITFKEMPNVRQLDEIKKAMGEFANEAVDQFGRKTGDGVRTAALAKDLRDALGRAAPDYNAAVRLGGDKIAEDNALNLGTKLFSPSTTREAVKDATAGMSQVERTRLASGLRMTMDEKLANVMRAVNDGNMDAREAIAAVRDFSSRANREKLAMGIGQREADALLQEVDRVTVALELRAGVAQNSKTFARTTIDDSVNSLTNDGMWNALKSGEPVNAGKRLVQSLFGTTSADKLAAKDKVYSEIAKALTEPRGVNAAKLIQALSNISRKAPQNTAKAKQIADMLGLSFAVPAYSASTELTKSLRTQ